jgi:hypothetical protein
MEIAHETYNQYITKILASKELYDNFKNDLNYTQMLEHVNYEQGLGYLNEIEKNTLKISLKCWKNMLTNDNVGSPITFEYHTPMGTFNISPTTLRYIHYGLQFLNHLGKNKFIRVVEIGAGYGGQYKIIRDLCTEFGIITDNYIIIELDNPAKLIQRYIQDRTNLTILTPKDIFKYDFGEIDYVLSYYCFSELPETIREFYTREIISHAKHGYIAWNMLPKSEISKLGKQTTISPEIPLTGGDSNCIVKW